MVSAEQKEILGIFDFVGEQQTNGFEALFAAIHVVAEEQVVGFRRETAILEETQQVVILAMNITANLQRRLQLQQDRLREEDFPRTKAKGPA